MPDISIVIPAYNEEPRIGKTLMSINEYIKSRDFTTEIIVVDDGSKDATSHIVQELTKTIPELILHSLPQNKGKGYAVKTGMLLSKGAYILFMDADSSTPITELDTFLKFNTHYDIVIGSRHLEEESVKKKAPFYRRLITYVGRTFFVKTLVSDIKDTQCGFKLFKHDIGHYLVQNQTIDGFAFDIELLRLAQKKGFTIKEVPVLWKHVGQSKFHPIIDTYYTMIEIVKMIIGKQH